jgi:hypothetical protein
MFLCKNTSISQWVPAMDFFTHGWGGFLLFAFLGMVYWKVWKGKTREKIVVGWAAMAFLAALIEAPLWSHRLYNAHLSQLALWNNQDQLTVWTFLKSMGSGFEMGFQYMFGRREDLAPGPFLSRDCFMDYFISIFGVVGLAFFVAKPTWTRISILALFLAAIITAILGVAGLWPHLLG